ncbi:aspartyl-phosphate phosphatase Spo0E family protein [Cohnella massiliensis]|uniref:aspartyl-phosphate phosphatase Spo0E family protein n=1 Tax=Cohnella massiliensis TaxID=1816691 RepID=UPI0009BADAC2|nr:aspartyl-phosphate phosphatase Spo0E family protein [Cohnella massiliensis]
METAEYVYDSYANSGNLADEIDILRRSMTEVFLREMSFTSEPVIEISRLLDMKINEYMKQALIAR